MSITITEMREKQNFIPWDEWDNTLNTNCIAYALGLQIDDPKKEIFRTVLLKEPISNLEKIFKDLGFIYRRINSETELRSGEYGIVLYHYFYEDLVKLGDCIFTHNCEETHLVRIEPDGIWTHKFGWDYPTSQTNQVEIHDIILEYDNVDVKPTAYFAVRKPR